MLQIPLFNPFRLIVLRTLPFSVHNTFPSKLFSFNLFHTLCEKHGGWVSTPPKVELWHPLPRITNHKSRITPLEAHSYRVPRCQFLCHQSLTKPNRNDMSTNHL